MTTFSLADHGITKATVQRNLSVARLYEEAIRHDPGASIAHNGALVAYSGEKTGRSPKDKRIVCNPALGPEHLVGRRQYPPGRAQLPDQSPAGH